MPSLDRVLDATLAGYTRLGASLRGISTSEPFPAIAGRHVMVTGATGGIGRAVVERLAAQGAVVHAVGRSTDKLTDLAASTDGAVVVHTADLSSMRSIIELADAYRDSGAPLHALVHNVGVMLHERTVTDEGFEATYATNLLGQYVLTRRLMPVLASSAPARIVLVSSGGMYSQGLTVDGIAMGEDGYDGTTAYARTKRGQVVLAEEWARELEPNGITVNAMHPGWVDTEGVRSALPTFRRLTAPVLRDAPQGADTIVWLVASEEAAGETGGFWHDRIARQTHRLGRTRTDDPDTRRRLLDRLARDAAPFLDAATDTDPIPETAPGSDPT